MTLTEPPTVSALYTYPIKSCAPVEVSSAYVDPQGFSGDRRFMVVDEQGRFVTARTHEKLTLVQPRFDGETLTITADSNKVTVNIHDLPPDRVSVDVWKDEVSARRCGPEVDSFFSDYLGGHYRLVFKDKDSIRRSRIGGDVSFADGAPVLAISEASLTALNNKLPTPMIMQRFRPNIIVRSITAHGEDGFDPVRIGDVEFTSMGPCSRCVLTTIDPGTAERHPSNEPLRTLMTYRQDETGKINFGQNLSPRWEVTVHVGDRITL